MKQESFSDMEYRCRKKKTKREEFLEIMDEIIPWDEWVSLIVPPLPQREAQASAHRNRNYAADVLAAMLVQPVRRGRKRRHL